MKFNNRAKFLKTVTQWIRDGSDLESFGENSDCVWIILRGSDGVKEELVFFEDSRLFQESDLIDNAEVLGK